jgi:hypothetical protein
MDRLWNDRTDLLTMQSNIETLIYSKVRFNIRISEVIRLSPEDYRFLIQKLHQIRTAEEIEHYSLSIVIAWISSYTVGHPDEMKKIADNLLRTLPQHHTKYILDSFSMMMSDYQIDNFGLPITSLDVLQEIMKRHAGCCSTNRH